MSTILYRPPSVNTKFDPGLEYIAQHEQQTVLNSTTAAGDTKQGVVLEQINNVITNIVRNDPADTVLDLVDLNLVEYILIDSSVTATILTGAPINIDRTIRLAPAVTMTGRRMIVINRSPFQHLIVQDSQLNTIVVVEGETSEEILSDGYDWIAVN
jgi:hypothetical protein